MSNSSSSPLHSYSGLDISPLLCHEFEVLRSISPIQNNDLSKFPSAIHPNNFHKNRYPNILANEDTKVTLSPLEAGEGDYINANYVDGETLNSRRAYILTQAPLPHTMADFWRMVWQEKSPVIACLTMLKENHRVKAHVYWPENGEMQQYGKIFVAHNLSVLFKNIIVRSFSIWKEGDNTPPMEVFQLHYQDWPDFGAPASTESIRAMCSLLTALRDRGRQKTDTLGPAIVHCSAGVGRAGTFVAAHVTLSKLEQTPISPRSPSSTTPASPLFEFPITIQETVSKLRRQRSGTVQTVDQYIFIYRVVGDSMDHPEMKRASGTFRKSQESNITRIVDGGWSVKDKVGVSAFLDILSGRPLKCIDNTPASLASSSEQIV